MKRKTILTLSALAATAVIGALAIPAIAGGGHGHWGPGMMMRGGGHGAMMPWGGHGRMGMHAMADNPIYRSFDADRDGTVTTGEAEAGITALHAKHDTDGNGSLSAAEFGALFAEVTRGLAERPFAMLDADGNKEISAEEMRFPVQMMARMQSWQGKSPFWSR